MQTSFENHYLSFNTIFINDFILISINFFNNVFIEMRFHNSDFHELSFFKITQHIVQQNSEISIYSNLKQFSDFLQVFLKMLKHSEKNLKSKYRNFENDSAISKHKFQTCLRKSYF